MDVRIRTVEPLPGYRVRLGLTDGRTIERDLSHLLPAPSEDTVFTPWHDPTYFAQVRVDEDWGTVVWPNGADLDPDVLIYDGPPPWATLPPSGTLERFNASDQAIQAAIDANAVAKTRLPPIEGGPKE
jgi:hypothetical protein